MKINCNSRDLKIINRNRGYGYLPCELNSVENLIWCCLCCRSGKVWIKDIFNSDIFKL